MSLIRTIRNSITLEPPHAFLQIRHSTNSPNKSYEHSLLRFFTKKAPHPRGSLLITFLGRITIASASYALERQKPKMK